MSKGITETKDCFLFWGGWPSQWHKANFAVDGIAYNCSEQFMMAEKARVFHDEKSLALILAASSPGKQKALGRKVAGFEEAIWNGVCRGIVYTGNLARFSQNGSLRRALLATGTKTIIEASPVDCIWGVGMAADHPDIVDMREWRGSNWLGFALMEVRKTLIGKRPIDAKHADQIARRQAMVLNSLM